MINVNIEVTNGVATVTLPVEMLATIRYALDCGATKLAADARFFKSLKAECYETTKETADKAMFAVKAIEEANLRWTHPTGIANE